MESQQAENVLSTVIFGKARRSILSLLYTHTDEQFHLRRIVRETGNGLGPVQREVKQLLNAGIIVRQNRDRFTYYQANPDCPIFHELKGIVLKTVGLADIIRSRLEPLKDKIELAFVYGPFAAGTESRRTPVDLLVMGDVKLSDIEAAMAPVYTKLNRRIKITLYTERQFRERFMNNNPLVISIMEGPKIFAIGSED
jgi:predicted nucleotidyltransferase